MRDYENMKGVSEATYVHNIYTTNYIVMNIVDEHLLSLHREIHRHIKLYGFTLLKTGDLS